MMALKQLQEQYFPPISQTEFAALSIMVVNFGFEQEK